VFVGGTKLDGLQRERRSRIDAMPHSLAAGIDAIELDRVRKTYKRHPERFLTRVFTDLEIAFCRGRVHELAVRFAAKEAMMKALGTGVRGVGWREIEILPNRAGAPQVRLYERAARRAAALGLEEVTVSISHERRMAVAVAVAHQRQG
jgi:holo-[acyl-carrier protein] synthase